MIAGEHVIECGQGVHDHEVVFRGCREQHMIAGFDPVEIGKLAAARRFQRGAPGYGQNVSAAELKQKLSLAP